MGADILDRMHLPVEAEKADPFAVQRHREWLVGGQVSVFCGHVPGRGRALCHACSEKNGVSFQKLRSVDKT
jgi:hypothetical protein